MKFGMYTVSKKDIEMFADQLPEYVIENCGKKGCFMIGAVDEENTLIGLAQFYIGMLEGGEFISDVIYVFVDEEYRRNGAASKMLNKVHSILKKSGIEKSLTLVDKKQEEKALFSENGYVFMKPDTDSVKEFEEVHGKIVPTKMEQGVYWLDR